MMFTGPSAGKETSVKSADVFFLLVEPSNPLVARVAKEYRGCDCLAIGGAVNSLR